MAVAQALSAAFLVAAMEVWVVQWTSYAVSAATLAIDFVVSGLVLAAIVVPVVAIVAGIRRAAALPAFLTAVVLGLAFYDVSRIHTEKLSWGDPVSLAVVSILAVGCRSVWRCLANGAAGLVVAPLLVAATAAAWVILHVRSFTPSVVVLGLICGVAALQVACGRWFSARESSPLHRPATAPLVLLAVAVAFSAASYPIVPGAVKLQVRRHDGPTVPVGRPLPDVVVIVMDTVRADHLSLYGYRYPTSPQLAVFAKQAHVFRRAIANSDWSLPSHATLLTGLLPHQHGAHTVIAATERRSGAFEEILGKIAQAPLPPGQKTITDRLREVGYDTAVVAANHGWLSDDWGLVRGFHYVENQPRSLVALDPFCAAYLRHQPLSVLPALYERSARSDLSADEVVDQAMDFLDRRGRRPFFLLLNFMDAHSPYTSAERAEGVPQIRERFGSMHWPAANLEAYDRSIAFLDDQLGRFFEALKSRGLFEESLIVVTADHGERFGPTGNGWHGDDLSQATLHIPLVIKTPHQASGETVDGLAQLADVAPTVLEAVGLPVPREFFGSPLGRQSRAVIAENYLSSGGMAGHTLSSHEPARFVSMQKLDQTLRTQWALFEGPWKIVRDADGEDFLYDLSEDPEETRNLAPWRPELSREMLGRLAALLPPGAFSDYRTPVAQTGVSTLAIEKLKSLGYAQ